MADLYETLGVARDADAATIKRAYLKLARETHPDKNAGDAAATERFQQVGRAYATLSDEEKRKIYDATGIVDDVGNGDPDYWRNAFEKVTLEKLDGMKESYQGSAEETEDLKRAYVAAKGDMGKVLDNVMMCTADDEPRFREQLQALIASGELPELRGFKASTTEAKIKVRGEGLGAGYGGWCRARTRAGSGVAGSYARGTLGSQSSGGFVESWTSAYSDTSPLPEGPQGQGGSGGRGGRRARQDARCGQARCCSWRRWRGRARRAAWRTRGARREERMRCLCRSCRCGSLLPSAASPASPAVASLAAAARPYRRTSSIGA